MRVGLETDHMHPILWPKDVVSLDRVRLCYPELECPGLDLKRNHRECVTLELPCSKNH